MAAHCAFACAPQRQAPELPTPLAAVCCAAATSAPGLRLAPVTTLHRDWAQAVVWVYPHTTASPQPLLHWGLAHPPTSMPGPAHSHERIRRHARACVGAHTSARTRMRGCAYVGTHAHASAAYGGHRRLFSSVEEAWQGVKHNPSDHKELIPIAASCDHTAQRLRCGRTAGVLRLVGPLPDQLPCAALGRAPGRWVRQAESNPPSRLRAAPRRAAPRCSARPSRGRTAS